MNKTTAGWFLLPLIAVLRPAAAVDEGTTYYLDPHATLRAENHLATDIPPATDWIHVNSLLGADRFYSAGITGQGTIAANVEAGFPWGGGTGHDTLRQVTAYVKNDDALGQTDRHATSVAMILGGRNGGVNQGDWQTGIAPGTDLRGGAIANSWSGSAYALGFNLGTASLLHTYDAFFGTADVINSSWGYAETAMPSWTYALDAMARANPQTTFVASAGNGGSGRNTVTGPGSGYNGIAVGALVKGADGDYNAVASFSSRGAQDYRQPSTTVASARAVVDLVAPGTGLAAAYYGGQTGGNGTSLSGSVAGAAGSNYYLTGLQGTSYAAPIVAGGVALLDSASLAAGLDDQSRDARVIRAVLMNSADKLPGWNNGQALIAGVVTTTQSLDWNQGAGRVNFGRAYDQYLTGTTDLPGLGGGDITSVGWDLGQVSAVGATRDYLFTTPLRGGSTLDVTLSWFRNRTVNLQTYSTVDKGFANLDLEVWDSTFSTRIAASGSLYNSVEHLHFDLPREGDYGLRVIYREQRFGIAEPETYGLAWFGTAALVVPEPRTLVLLGVASVALLGLNWRSLRRGRVLRALRAPGQPCASAGHGCHD